MAVVVEMTSDEQALFRGMQKLIGQQRQFEDSLKKSGQAGKQAGKDIKQVEESASKAFNPKAVAGWAAALTALALPVINQIRREIENIRELQTKAAAEQVTLASARRSIIRNLPGASADTVRSALSESAAIARRTQVEERFIAPAIAAALSGTGGNLRLSAASVEAAARFIPDQPADIPLYAGAIADLSAVTRSEDAMANLGLLQFIGGRSRITNPQQQARNIPSALVGQIGFGATAAEASSLFTALTVAAKDAEGAVSGNAAIKFTEQLDEFSKTLQSEAVGPLLPPGMRVGTAGDTISWLQQRQDMAARFLDEMSVEAKAKAPLMDLLLNPESDMARMFRENMAAIPSVADLRSIGTASLGSFGLDPLSATEMARRTFEQATQEILTSDPALGLSGVAREGILKMLQATGESDLSQRIEGLRLDAGSLLDRRGAMQSAYEMLHDRYLELQEGSGRRTIKRYDPMGGYSDEFGNYVMQSGTPFQTEGDVQTSGILRELLVTLGRLLEVTGEQRDLMKRMEAKEEHVRRRMLDNSGTLVGPPAPWQSPLPMVP